MFVRCKNEKNCLRQKEKYTVSFQFRADVMSFFAFCSVFAQASPLSFPMLTIRISDSIILNEILFRPIDHHHSSMKFQINLKCAKRTSDKITLLLPGAFDFHIFFVLFVSYYVPINFSIFVP